MTPHFERDLDDPHQSVVTDFRFPTRPLLIAFGGMAGRLGIPPFEFFNVTRHLDVNRVYLRDLSQTWYHAGLPGVSESIDDTACFLRSKIAESGSKRVVVVGNSAGGYAAILFGVLIGADMIHAFSPHTSLHNPDHIRSVKRLLFVQKNFADKYFDLSNLLTTKSMSSRIHIYYNSGNAIDTTHAVHLERLRKVVLVSFPGTSHGLVKKLKNAGALEDIIVSSFDRWPIRSAMAGLLGRRLYGPSPIKRTFHRVTTAVLRS